MLSNLKAEMARYDVSINDIAVVVGRSYRTICDRLNGKSQFPIDDAITVKNRFFQGIDTEYLFTQANEIPDIEQRGA